LDKRAAEALLALPDGLNPEDIPAELKPVFLALTLEPLLDSASRTLGHTTAQQVIPLPDQMNDSAGMRHQI